MDSSKYTYEDYTIGWVCALPNEQAAAMFMLDERHEDLPNPSGDYNAYTLGSIGKHKVVIAGLPKGRYGNTSSATVATRMVSTFPNIKFGLMVGVGGGIPQKTRLGDVVISCPTASEPGVVQWDMGRAEHSGNFRRTGSLAPPPTSLLTALGKFEADQMASRTKMLGYLDDMRWMPNVRKSFLKSDSLKDVLYKSEYSHVEGDDCTHCDPRMVVDREPREEDLVIHCGLIASGNQVIKDAMLRDSLYRKFDENLLCIEMEAAGLMNEFPCIVIRGICDYADSHKNRKWQDYAAAVASACAKAYLTVVPAGEVDKLQRVQGRLTFGRSLLVDVCPC
ncbi:purine and uridine phosphorylase [Trichoderma citrinoviride]|uniref:Purine and uridine phosphorylase n=1 Tax=Trichoderma citrinoviride TaxID=58853 RepID=A0A2T4B973_9HYPO|nr:purine and uridine phosphorylase [Trichoderma citrinoviride]PTB65882.1 purine and uridine phosphorylase [Trichoderma citrinoviride]